MTLSTPAMRRARLACSAALLGAALLHLAGRMFGLPASLAADALGAALGFAASLAALGRDP